MMALAQRKWGGKGKEDKNGGGKVQQQVSVARGEVEVERRGIGREER
jgi:hypothetical protein